MNWVTISVLTLATAGLAAEPNDALDLNQQGVDADAREDFEAATQYYRSALEIWRSLGPSFDKHRSITMVNLAQALVTQAKWAEAAAIAEEALPVIRANFGPADLHAVTCLNVQGVAETLRGHDAKAEALFAEALPLARALQPASVELAHTLSGLAGLRIRSGRLEEAAGFGEEALDVTLKTAGELSAETALEFSVVAIVHRAAGRTDRALPLFRKSHDIYERTGRNGSIVFASLLGEEAIAMADDRQFAAAEKNLSRARQILGRCATCRFQSAVVNSELGYLRLRQQKYAEADRLLTAALEVEQRTAPGATVQIAGTLRMLAEVREKQKRFAEAAELKTKAETLEGRRNTDRG